jgi:hypothetical protein
MTGDRNGREQAAHLSDAATSWQDSSFWSYRRARQIAFASPTVIRMQSKAGFEAAQARACLFQLLSRD